MAASQETLALIVKQLQLHALQIEELQNQEQHLHSDGLLLTVSQQQKALGARLDETEGRLSAIEVSLARLTAALTAGDASAASASSSLIRPHDPQKVTVSSSTLSILGGNGNQFGKRARVGSDEDYDDNGSAGLDDDDGSIDDDDDSVDYDDESKDYNAAAATRPATSAASSESIKKSQAEAAAAAWADAVAAARACVDFRLRSDATKLTIHKKILGKAQVELKAAVNKSAAGGDTSYNSAHRRLIAAKRSYNLAKAGTYNPRGSSVRATLATAWCKAAKKARATAQTWVDLTYGS